MHHLTSTHTNQYVLKRKNNSRVIYKYYYERSVMFMKQGVKLAIVGIAGYFIGYYKFKYKFVKTIANEYIDSQLKNDDTDETES